MSTTTSAARLPRTILLADSSKSYREITRKMLKFYEPDFVIDDCASIDACLQKTASQNFDLIVADERLDDGDNLTLYNALRHKGRSTPILMLFNEGSEDKAYRATELGAVDYLIKSRGYLTALPHTIKKALDKIARNGHDHQIADVGPRETKITQRGYFILNHRGKFLSANPGMEAITGYNEDELLELTLLDLLPKGKEWDLFEWLQEVEAEGKGKPFQTQLLGKFGAQINVSLRLTPVRDRSEQLKSYRGEIEEIVGAIDETEKDDEGKEQLELVDRVWDVIQKSRHDPMPRFLEKFSQLCCQFFRFHRSTVALLDKQKQSYVKVAMVGYSMPVESERRRLEVPKDIIDSKFASRYRIKVLYYSQQNRTESDFISPLVPDRRSQIRPSVERWHPRDVVLINLANRQMNTFGYISLDNPIKHFAPTRTFFHHLELFSRLASMAIEEHAQNLEQEQRHRRLKQVLVASNIFKLHLSMQDLLKEVVWSIKFSLDYNLVALVLISQRSGRAEVRAVACDDKIVAGQIQALSFDIRDFTSLLDNEARLGRSYFVTKPHRLLRAIKDIYHTNPLIPRGDDSWPAAAGLIVPLKTRFGKVMGAVIVDDPADLALPDEEYRRTLEILANQISVAIDNRVMYVEVKRGYRAPNPGNANHKKADGDGQKSQPAAGRRSFWDKIFREA